MQLKSAERIYERVNVAGRLSDAYVQDAPWIRAALHDLRQHLANATPHHCRAQPAVNPGIRSTDELIHAAYAAPFGTRVKLRWQLGVAIHLALPRVLWPLAAMVHPGCTYELLYGRGHSRSLGPDLFGDAAVAAPLSLLATSYSHLTRYGVAGLIHEICFERLAGIQSTSNSTEMLLVAILFRTLLQPVRLVTAGCMLGAAVVLAALHTLVVCAFEACVTQLRAPQGPRAQTARGLHAKLALLDPLAALRVCTPWAQIQDHDLALRLVPPIKNQSILCSDHINELMRVNFQYVFSPLQHVADEQEYERQVVARAHHFADQLKRLCALVPEETAYPYGMCLLRSYVATSVDDEAFVAFVGANDANT